MYMPFDVRFLVQTFFNRVQISRLLIVYSGNLLLLSVEANRMKSIPKVIEKIHGRFGILPGNSFYQY